MSKRLFASDSRSPERPPTSCLTLSVTDHPIREKCGQEIGRRKFREPGPRRLRGAGREPIGRTRGAATPGLPCRARAHRRSTPSPETSASAKEAKETAFCLSTDATGVCVQPEPAAGRQRQACRKGHFFVVLADKEHVFFEFQTKHTSAPVCEMFRGFSLHPGRRLCHLRRGLSRRSQRERARPATQGGGLLEPLQEAGVRGGRRRQRPSGARSPASHAGALRARSAVGGYGPRAAARSPGSSPRARSSMTSSPGPPSSARGSKARAGVAAAFGYAIRQEAALRRFLDDGCVRRRIAIGQSGPSRSDKRLIAMRRIGQSRCPECAPVLLPDLRPGCTGRRLVQVPPLLGERRQQQDPSSRTPFCAYCPTTTT
jgi:hypothetical protein